jgi:hypothetical protein
MILPLDGPSAHATLSVNATTVQEVKAGASALEERKVITIQPANKIYIYFGDGISAPSSATVIANGMTLFKDALMSFEATYMQPVYILSVSGTVSVKIAERA